MKKITIIISALVFLFACNSEKKQNSEESTSNYLDALEQAKTHGDHMVTVLEIINVDNYTYAKVDESGKKFWMAITARQIQTGNQYYYKGGIMMYDFTSKQLEQTFDSIMFIRDFSDQSFADNNTAIEDFRKEKTTNTTNKTISIELPEDGISLGDLYKNKDQHKGKFVIVRGVVVKLNEMIMGKNWVHIQDGSSFENFFDLTLTTKEAINFSIGDTISFKGVVSLDKDFGAGYLYPLIMEDAKIWKK